MLVVKVELWPLGSAALAREIGRLGIANLTANAISDYIAVLSDDTGRHSQALIRGHSRGDGFWPLVARAAAAQAADFSDPPSRELKALADRVRRRMHG